MSTIQSVGKIQSGGEAAVPVNSEVDRELRDLLHIEIENKSKVCSNPTFECSIPRIDGYEFCIRHILKDPYANYKQCAFTYQSGKKCTNAALRHDIRKDPALTSCCFEHSRFVQLNKTRSIVGKFKRTEYNETFLNNISHHLNIEEPSNKAQICELDEEIDVVSPNVRPFVNYEQLVNLREIVPVIRKKKRILDYASDSSSGEDLVIMNAISKAYEWNSSDNESVDSRDDSIKHAGIYTRQEAILVSEKKLVRLQRLYIDQIIRLQHVLREKRRRYLHAIRKERETLCSIHDQIKDSSRERKFYEKIKSLNHYHKRYGIEAVLYKKFKEKRSKSTEGYVCKSPMYMKCIFTEGGVKCGDRALPSCKFCRKHILEDKKQILYRVCGVEKSGVICQESVPNIFEYNSCVLHIQLPIRHQYIQKKYESETEDEEDLTTNGIFIIKKDASKSPISVNTKCADDTVHENLEEDSKKNVTISHDSPRMHLLKDIQRQSV